MQDFHDAQELKMDDSCDERIAKSIQLLLEQVKETK
jgi:hypothetical protein